MTTQPVGGIDGIEPDGCGGLLVTDVIGQRLLQVSKGGDVTRAGEVHGRRRRLRLRRDARLAIVPFLFGNSVAAYDLTAALK